MQPIEPIGRVSQPWRRATGHLGHPQRSRRTVVTRSSDGGEPRPVHRGGRRGDRVQHDGGAPADSSAWAACVIVAPVVTTSSTTRIRWPRTSGRARNTEPGEPFTSGAARLRAGCRRPIEQPASGQAELRGDVAGEEFTLVEPTLATS